MEYKTKITINNSIAFHIIYGFCVYQQTERLIMNNVTVTETIAKFKIFYKF